MWSGDDCTAAEVHGSWAGPRPALKFLGNVNKRSALTGTWMKGEASAAYCHSVVIKRRLCKSGGGGCERAPVLNCLLGVHTWKETWERRVEIRVQTPRVEERDYCLWIIYRFQCCSCVQTVF